MSVENIHAPETATTSENGRDAQGRFRIGNPGGPGNPFARRVAELRKAMLAAVREEDIAAIVQALIEKAKEGNVQAAKVVLSYTLGKPQPVADPDRVDAHEWELERETAAMMPELGMVLKAPPADVPLRTARVLRPLVGSIVTEKMAAMFTEPERDDADEFEEEPIANGDFAQAPAGLEDSAARRGPSGNGDLEAVLGGLPGGLEELLGGRAGAAEWMNERFGSPSANGEKRGAGGPQTGKKR